MTRALLPAAGDYLAFRGGRTVRYVERVETRDGEGRPRYWPGFVLVLRDDLGRVERGGLPRGARDATRDEVAAFKARHDAVCAPLPLDDVLVPTRVYAAPAEQAALF